jgi:hypothetical protein
LSWSTSASTSMLAESTVQRLKLETETHGPNSPGFFRSPTLSAAGRNVGPLDFVVLPMQLSADFDGMIGRNFFEAHTVCLDYQRQEVRVR